MAFTVVPLHNLRMAPGTVVPFGKYSIQDVPEWLPKDKILKRLSAQDRDSVRRAQHALISEYEADSYGHPDPEWTGHQPRGIQDLRWESALLANFSIWAIWPSPVCVTVGFHAMTRLGGHQENIDPPFIQATSRETNLFCHERDFQNVVERVHLVKAARLFETLSTVPRNSAVWPALRAFWAALTAYRGDLRYPLYWQGLESLFGSETNIRDVSVRLRNRISYFLAEDKNMQVELHDKIKACYSERSAIVHGRWEDTEDFHKIHMYTTEAIVRTVIRHIADRPGMLQTFLSSGRDGFLESWVKSRSCTPPPMPS